MARKKHKLDEVLRTLSLKKDCRIIGDTVYTLVDKTPFKANDLGNGSWGKIDFLVNHMGYSHVPCDGYPDDEN